MPRHPGGRTCNGLTALLPFYALKALALVMGGRHPVQRQRNGR